MPTLHNVFLDVKNRINVIMVSVGLVVLSILTILITLTGTGIIEPRIYPVGSALIIAIPMVVTSVAVFLMKLILSAIFNWWMSNYVIANNETDTNILVVVANSYVTGIIQAFERAGMCRKIPFLAIVVGIIAASIGMLKIGVGFAITTTTMPGLLSINGGKFYADPLNLTSCKVHTDAGCSEFFQDRFRFKWTQRASDVLINGISKQLSANWGDVADGSRVIMVATTDNDTSITYKLVQTETEAIPVFSLITTCDGTSYLESLNFGNLSIQARTPLSQLLPAVQADSGLEGRWMAEIINLEQDSNHNETTRITVNLVQILALNSLCEGEPHEAGGFLLCYPIKEIQVKCYMRTHVEYANYVTAGCDSCGTRGITDKREPYSSPKPVYGEHMHRVLALYGGNILIPQCTDDSVGGCLTPETNSADQVRDKFIELLRGIVASGVMARRSLLSNMGKEIPIQSLVKGTTGVRLDVGMGYWVTMLVMYFLCLTGFVIWLWKLKDKEFCYEYHEISGEWLLSTGQEWKKKAKDQTERLFNNTISRKKNADNADNAENSENSMLIRNI